MSWNCGQWQQLVKQMELADSQQGPGSSEEAEGTYSFVCR